MFMRDYENYGVLTSGCNSSFISLIPKMGDPLYLKYYRPINLVGCIYKVLYNVLANRLKKVIDKIISSIKIAYVEGRSILHGPLLLNEIVSWSKNA
uniref:Reverse transcriptase domain-containing protein n=1 Tax=Lactuca sativa TaxID=4236 RepID=A0A9R1WEP3_LACSA|nr:hypothetical protein LSAT_V11C200080410 [Lactuca sativa]